MKFKTEVKKPEFNYDCGSFQNAFYQKDSFLISKLKNDPVVAEAAELLKKGELVALPTETVYGLAANAVDQEAVKKIFTAKGRPQDNPLIVHIAQKQQLAEIVTEIPLKAEKLIDKFWPGPLTLIFSKKDLIPDQTSAGLDTVAVRMPADPLILAVIELSGLVLAAPSANRSGYPSPTQAEHVYHDLKGKIPLILDGGPCHFGVESTVLDIRGKNVKILRPGGISRQELAEFLDEKILSAAENVKKDQKALAPGMKYRHYAPEKKLFTFNTKERKKVLKKALAEAGDDKIALLVARETEIEAAAFEQDKLKIMPVFSRQKPQELAHRLFALLRQLDADPEIKAIYIEELETAGIGEAVMNRILKAAAAENDFQPGGGDY